MAEETPAKRRGGQPGNQNARKNRGNKTERRHRFARGNRLGGAPLGNQNARTEPKSKHQIVLNDYRDQPEAAEWIREHAAELDDATFTGDEERDRALFAAIGGLTPDLLAAKGLEYKLRLYTAPDLSALEDDDLAA